MGSAFMLDHSATWIEILGSSYKHCIFLKEQAININCKLKKEKQSPFYIVHWYILSV